VNTSSVLGLIGVFGYTDYCASKFALVGFAEALRGEFPGRATPCTPERRGLTTNATKVTDKRF
jgi:short-subunit dehydrogenase